MLSRKGPYHVFLFFAMAMADVFWPNRGHSLYATRIGRMLMRWMCGVLLGGRKDLHRLSGFQSVADEARDDRLRWFGHFEHKSR